MKSSILLHLDTDALPSVFDRVVAVDAGADHVFSYGGVTPQNVMPLVHGCIFTRGPKDLHRTAIFIGGSDVEAGEAVLAEVKKHLLPDFGLSVSVMLDSNGSNTTASAAVAVAAKYLDLTKALSLVLGGTGPVGKRVAKLLAQHGGPVTIGSRDAKRAEAVAKGLQSSVAGANVTAVGVATGTDAPTALQGKQLVVAAGAPGALLLPKKHRTTATALKVAIDLNGVPPAGIEGLDLMDQGIERDGVIAFGALGVGATKMKLHKAAIRHLFTINNATLDLEQIYALVPTL